jgi:hypothetical protein
LADIGIPDHHPACGVASAQYPSIAPPAAGSDSPAILSDATALAPPIVAAFALGAMLRRD